MNRFWLPFSEMLKILSKKTLHCLCRLFFCLFLFKQPLIVFFTKQLVCVSLEEEKINTNRFWLPFSESSDLLSRKPMHCLFGLFFCLFLFQQPVVKYVSLNSWCVFHQKTKEINTIRFWLTFSELLKILSRKSLHRLFQFFFCLFLFKQNTDFSWSM